MNSKIYIVLKSMNKVFKYFNFFYFNIIKIYKMLILISLEGFQIIKIVLFAITNLYSLSHASKILTISSNYSAELIKTISST